MRRISLISTGVLLLFLGAIAPASAKQDQRDQSPQTQRQEQTKPEGHQQAKPDEQKQARPRAQQQKTQTQAKPAKQEQRQQPKNQPEQARSDSKQQEQQNQARSQQAQTKQNGQQRHQQAKNQQEQVGRQREQSASLRPPQRTEAEQTRQRAEPSLRLSAMGNRRIPDARFRSNFGRTHEFRIGSPRMVDGYSRFQYGGYWFGFVQPWPANWYYLA